MSASALSHPPPPLTPADTRGPPLLRAAYSDRTAWLMAILAQLAYVPFVDQQAHPGRGQPKTLAPGGWSVLEPWLAPAGFTICETFNKGDVQSYLAVDPARFAVLAFRGTANWGDWQINLNAGRAPMPGFGGVSIHKGFWAAFEDSHQDILTAVDRHVPANLALYITGHSLGGALAQIASAVLERDNLAACYTFGSPRVANGAFDRVVKCPHYRVVNHWDLVPGVPLPTPWGYRHTGDPRLIDGARPREALRHDHNVLARFAVDLASALWWAITHNFGAVNDHMIWNYRSYLKEIAMARARPPAIRLDPA
jgi:hypothetical protein